MDIRFDIYGVENFIEDQFNKYEAIRMMEEEWNQYRYNVSSKDNYIDFDSQEAIDDSEVMYRMEKEF